MPHIHREPGQHDQTASAYIVCEDEHGVRRVLVHMHKKFHRLLQPGGHVELNENPWAAIAHELEEETGYSLKELEVMQPRLRLRQSPDTIIHPQPLFINTHLIDADTDHRHTDIAFLFLAKDTPSKAPIEGESTDIRWLTKQEVGALSPDLIFENIRRAMIAALTDFMDEWEPVLTAEFKIKEKI